MTKFLKLTLLLSSFKHNFCFDEFRILAVNYILLANPFRYHQKASCYGSAKLSAQRALPTLSPHTPHAPCALRTSCHTCLVSYVFSCLSCLMWSSTSCVLCLTCSRAARASNSTCFCPPRLSLASGVSRLTCSYASHVLQLSCLVPLLLLVL